MTDYKEEQAMEVEALESIYMDEFKKLSDDPLSYQIHIVPNQDGQNNHVALTLKCQIPETYPDVEPHVEIVLEKGLSDPQYKELKQLVMQHVSENMGMAMMFMVCEAVREYLVENNREGNDGSEYQEMMRRLEIRKKQDTISSANDAAAAAKAEEANKAARKDYGTPVTVETFMAWRAKFEAEQRASKKESVKDDATAKLTGRQLWSRGLIGDESTEMDDDEEDDDSDYVEGEEDEEDDDADEEQA
ncbi:hypothetical protein P43SY_002432 [Pythium insidiosum]|uniref:RWD domain-containing protein n=1 Tax=Pythium insidiosum TaxID=114742 RepID=A0AAD5LB98_PYTIN|nr:hypothetical protein P43SY_002432 [Pythium insidiosum]